MGKQGNWLTTFKRVFSHKTKRKKSQKPNKSRRGWGFGKCSTFARESLEDNASDALIENSPPPQKSQFFEGIKLGDAESEQSKHAYSVALATAVVAEAAAVAAKAAAEVARLTASTRYSPKSREEIAAIKIQTAFRGYLARRALRALRGLVRLKSLVHGSAAKRQTMNTLHCMQTLARVQSQIRTRRTRMAEENQALQRQLQVKHEREFEKLKLGEEWDDSLRSKEHIEAKLLNKQEAAIRRERALAYAFSQQSKNCTKSINPTFLDPNNPEWGWSWLDRWMASRPWEVRGAVERELDHASIRSAGRSSRRVEKTKDRFPPLPLKPSRPPSHHSPSTPPSKAPSVIGRDSRNRRHSIGGGSSMGDDESLTSSYAGAARSVKARSRFQSPSSEKIESLGRETTGPVRKRLSFSPARARRHSGPLKVDVK